MTTFTFELRQPAVIEALLATPAEHTFTLPALQGPSGAALVNTPVTDVAYDVSGRLINFTRAGVPYVVTYGVGQVIIAGGGITRTVNLDGDGRLVSVTIT